MAIPEYQRTIVRQVQQADTASAQVWETLANTLDNFGQQAGALSRNMIANDRAAAKQQKAANDLARKNYLDSMEADIIEAAHQAQINNPDDYQAYVTEFDKKAEIWLNSEGLDSMSGARQLLQTMIGNKRTEYGKKPYEAEQVRIKTQAISDAEKNLDVDIKDFVHQAGEFLERGMNPPLDEQMEVEISDMDFQVMRQYEKLEAKINDIVTLNGQSVDEAMAFEIEMQEQYISGVIGKQLTQEVNNNAGWDALQDFYTNPDKFIRDRAYLSALIPDGVKISDKLKDDLYTEMNQYLADYNKELDAKEKKEEDDLVANQLDTFTLLKVGIQDGAVIHKENLMQAYKAEDISGPQFEQLMEDIVSNKYVKDNEEVAWDLYQNMIDPSLTMPEKNRLIQDALDRDDITGNTAASYLDKALSASKVTTKPYFSQANSAIAKAFGVTEAGMNIFGDSGLSEEDVANMRYAQQELYERVQNGEKAIDIYNGIIERYTSEDNSAKVNRSATSNLSFQDSYTMPNGFNTYFVGTPSKTQGGATTLKIGKDLDEGIITEEEAELLAKQLKDYVNAQLGYN
jgi:hypothetical protein